MRKAVIGHAMHTHACGTTTKRCRKTAARITLYRGCYTVMLRGECVRLAA